MEAHAYKTVAGPSIEALDHRVNYLLGEGWVICGHQYSTEAGFYQPMAHMSKSFSDDERKALVK